MKCVSLHGFQEQKHLSKKVGRGCVCRVLFANNLEFQIGKENYYWVGCDIPFREILSGKRRVVLGCIFLCTRLLLV